MLNCRDRCPDDANKLTPGVCGCGSPDVDVDGDEIVDCPVASRAGCGGCGALGLVIWPLSILTYAGVLLYRRRRK